MKKSTYFLSVMGIAAVLCGCGTGDLTVNSTTEKADTVLAQESSGTGENAEENTQKDNTQDKSRESSETADGKDAGSVTELLASWDFAYGSVSLEQVTADLEQNGIHYAGYYNVSGERLDLTLEDGTLLVFLEVRDPEQEYWERTNRYELMLKGEELNENAFQEKYLNEYDVTDDEFMWPDLSGEELERNRLAEYNQTDLSIARNQVFAKYGRKFADPFLQAVFARKNWYHPQYEGSDFDSKMQDFLTDTEKKNLKTVTAWEEEQNYRKTGDYDTMKKLLPGSWVDLDGDGQEERILYTVKAEDPEGEAGMVTLTVQKADGSGESVEKELFQPHNAPYLCSLTEGICQIAIAENGMSADYRMEFFELQNGNISPIGSINTNPESVQIRNGKLTALAETFHLQNEPIRFTYERKQTEGKAAELVEKKQDYYEYRGNEVTVLQEIDFYQAAGDAAPAGKLQKKERVIVLGGDLTNWVKLRRVSDSAELWIPVTEGECTLPDGTKETSGLVFEGLTFYG